MGNISMNDPFSLNALPWFLKIILSIIGVVFALVLSGDIDQDGRIKITPGLLIRFSFGVAVSLFGGEAFIEFYKLTSYSLMMHGFIMLMFAVFGMLIIGILYQALAMWRGKSLSEIITEVKAAFSAIFGGK